MLRHFRLLSGTISLFLCSLGLYFVVLETIGRWVAGDEDSSDGGTKVLESTLIGNP